MNSALRRYVVLSNVNTIPTLLLRSTVTIKCNQYFEVMFLRTAQKCTFVETGAAMRPRELRNN